MEACLVKCLDCWSVQQWEECWDWLRGLKSVQRLGKCWGRPWVLRLGDSLGWLKGFLWGLH